MSKDGLSELGKKLKWCNKLQPIIEKLEKFSEIDQYHFLSEMLGFLTEKIDTADFFYIDMEMGSVPRHDFGPDFKVIEPGPPAQIGRVKVSLISYLNESDRDLEGNNAINGHLLRERSGGCKSAGIRDGEKLIMLQEQIPSCVRKNFFIPLTGTLLWRMSDRDLYIPCLERNASTESWRIGIRGVETSFSSRGRLIQFEKSG
jgi:hypothetical protein